MKLGTASGSVAAGTYKAYGGTGLYSGTLTGTVNQPYGFVASQGQTYASMTGVSGAKTFPTTNTTLAIPGYTIVGVRHSNSTTDIPQTGISGTVSTNMKQYASMEAALTGTDQYFDYPFNIPTGRHDFTTTQNALSSGIDQFAVLYQAIKPTIQTKNAVISMADLANLANLSNDTADAQIYSSGFVSFTTTNQTNDTSYSDFASTNNNNPNGNLATITGPNGFSTVHNLASQIESNGPGIYTITYNLGDPVNNAQATAVTAQLTVVGGYGFTTEVSQGAAITGNETNIPGVNDYSDQYSSHNDLNVVADNTPWNQGQALQAGATLSQGTVSNLTAVDSTGNSITDLNLQTTDIVADNTGKVTIASGKLTQPGTYSFNVTYTYTTSDGLTQDVVVQDTITVDPPFSLPFTGGEGLAMIGGISAVAFIAAVALYATKRKKTEEES